MSIFERASFSSPCGLVPCLSNSWRDNFTVQSFDLQSSFSPLLSVKESGESVWDYHRSNHSISHCRDHRLVLLEGSLFHNLSEEFESPRLQIGLASQDANLFRSGRRASERESENRHENISRAVRHRRSLGRSLVRFSPGKAKRSSR